MICDRRLYKNSSRNRLLQAAQAVFMKTVVEIWRKTKISPLHNTFCAVVWIRKWKLRNLGSSEHGLLPKGQGAQCDNKGGGHAAPRTQTLDL